LSAATKTKPQVAVMNAVHDLPVLVARELPIGIASFFFVEM